MMMKTHFLIIIHLLLYRPSLRQSIQPHKCKFFISRHAQEEAKGQEFLFLVLRILEGRIGREEMLNSTGILVTQEGFLSSLTITLTLTPRTIRFTQKDFNYYTIYLLPTSGQLNEARTFRSIKMTVCTKKDVWFVAIM